MVRGVLAITFDESPDPTMLTARIATWYRVPFVSPVIVIGLESAAVDVHVDPPFVEY
jgi:hypothetical protein